MSDRPIFAFAGTGSIGQRHIRNLRACVPDAQLVFLRRGARQDDLSATCQATVVGSMAEVLAHAPKGLFISTPSAAHHETLFDAIRANVPVYIEKPAVTMQTHVDEIYRLLETRPRYISLVGCNLRFLPSLQAMFQIVQAGDIGAVAQARLEAGQWLPDWRPSQDHRVSYSADPDAGGGVIFDLLHELDVAEWICGPLEVHAATAIRVPTLEIKSEAAAQILLKGQKSDVLAAVHVDYVARQPIREYRVTGTLGTVTWSLGAQRLTLETTDGSSDIACGADGFDMQATYVRAMQDFLRAVRTGASTLNPLETGLRSCALAVTAREMTC